MPAPRDLTDHRFGKLTAVHPIVVPGKARRWQCRCDCGGEVIHFTGNLTHGRATSCGCTRNPLKAGQKFGRLTLTADAGKFRGRSHWHCKCDCGAERLVDGSKLKIGHTTSCGCARKGRISPRRLHPHERMKRQVFSAYKANAKKKNITLDLTLESAAEFFQSDCHYCGRPPCSIKTKDRTFGQYVYKCQIILIYLIDCRSDGIRPIDQGIHCGFYTHPVAQ